MQEIGHAVTQGAREWLSLTPPAEDGEIQAVEDAAIAQDVEAVGDSVIKKRRT